MNLTVERLPQCKARLSAEIPSDTVKEQRQQLVSSYVRQARVPGFRPGKTPVAVIEKRFAASIEEELKERLVNSAFTDARSKEDLRIIGVSEVEREEFDPNGTFLLAMEVVTEPKIDDLSYQNIEVKIPRQPSLDEALEERIKNILEYRAEDVTVERPAQKGDTVQVKYEGQIDGAPAIDQVEEDVKFFASHENFPLQLVDSEGRPEFFPGVLELLIGKSAGDAVSHTITFEEGYPFEKLVGKTIDYTFTVNQVQEKHIPELNEDFAKEVGFESVEDLKNQVRESLEQQLENQRRDTIINSILVKLAENSDFELPQNVLLNETQNQVNRIVYDGYEQGLKDDALEENREIILKNAEVQAKNNVTISYVLGEIARRENIEATEREVINRIAAIAESRKQPFKKLVAQLRRENGIERIFRDVRISKTLEFLRANAQVEEVDSVEETA